MTIDGFQTTRATCVLAPNPGPMTLDGTNTWIIAEPGSSSVVVIDPVQRHEVPQRGRAREPDPEDGRRKRLQVTPRGTALLGEGEAVFEDLRRGWEQQIGATQLAEVEDRLTALVGEAPLRFDTLGRMSISAGGLG